MDNLKRYNDLNSFYKSKFGERVLKICIDGDFTCPNRDGSLGFSGCIFCSEKGSGENINSFYSSNNNQLESNQVCKTNIYMLRGHNSKCIVEILNNIHSQVKNYFNSYKANRANKFIVYFQNFTNTYDSIENLRAKYDAALCDERIIGIAIATRPDCITEDIAKLISTYSKKYYVCVELGLQSSNENTLKIIKCGYTSKDFENAVIILKKYNISIVGHIMVGLPYETKKDLICTVNYLNNQRIDGIKIHSTYVVKNTLLEKMFNNGDYNCLTLEEYIDLVETIILHLDPKIIIHRISGDAPKQLLVAPLWNSHKKWIINGIDKSFKQDNIIQGLLYKNSNKNIIICGPKGSGKTMLAKNISKRLNLPYINNYEIIENLHNKTQFFDSLANKNPKHIVNEKIKSISNKDILINFINSNSGYIIDLCFSLSPKELNATQILNNSKIYFLGFCDTDALLIFNMKKLKMPTITMEEVELELQTSQNFKKECFELNFSYSEINKNREEILNQLYDKIISEYN